MRQPAMEYHERLARLQRISEAKRAVIDAAEKWSHAPAGDVMAETALLNTVDALRKAREM